MEWMSADGYALSRMLLTRSLAAVYVLAFVGTARQWRPLLGEDGLTPVTDLLGRVPPRAAPSLFHWRYSDRLAVGLAWTGAGLAAAVVVGIPQQGPWWLVTLTWLAIYGLYLSYVSVGRIWYGFGWESIILEAAFFAAFLGPEDVAPPIISVFLLRWLLFRVEFGAGMIKMRGDPCWRDLTCLYYHHETQPLPNGLSWYFHHLPRPLHRVEVGANHVAQLVVPFLLFTPQPVAGVAGVVMGVTQGWLVLSGNFSWLNVLTIVLSFSAIPDAWWEAVLPLRAGATAPVPEAFGVTVLVVAAGTAVLSWWPVRNLISRGQRMNVSHNPFHLVGSYGAFGGITRRRYEVIVEGRRGGDEWHEYGFRAKPGDPTRRPPQVAPHHLRLDWLMWFIPLQPGAHQHWFRPFLEALLRADGDVLRLLRHDPFDGEPPDAVRARLFHYRFSTPRERRETGAWWIRSPERDLVATLGRSGRVR